MGSCGEIESICGEWAHMRSARALARCRSEDRLRAGRALPDLRRRASARASAVGSRSIRTRRSSRREEQVVYAASDLEKMGPVGLEAPLGLRKGCLEAGHFGLELTRLMGLVAKSDQGDDEEHAEEPERKLSDRRRNIGASLRVCGRLGRPARTRGGRRPGTSPAFAHELESRRSEPVGTAPAVRSSPGEFESGAMIFDPRLRPTLLT